MFDILIQCEHFPPLGYLAVSQKGEKMSYESLSHSKWDYKYYIVFVPHCRKKILYGKIRTFLGPKFHELAYQRESKIISENGAF